MIGDSLSTNPSATQPAHADVVVERVGFVAVSELVA